MKEFKKLEEKTNQEEGCIYFHAHLIYKEKKKNLISFLPILGKQRGLIISIILATFLITIISTILLSYN